jgi:hypothetical protein
MIADLGSSRWIEPDSSLRQSQINDRQSSILGVIFVVVLSSSLVMCNDLFISGQTLATSSIARFNRYGRMTTSLSLVKNM